MNLHLIDWGIIAGLLAVLVWAGLTTQRYSRSVAGFLAAERCGGRYLISVASGMGSLGVITLVWFFEQRYEVGYVPEWWAALQGPVAIIMAISGWVVYRFRQTRALTLAQYFEMRYSRRFRIFAGCVGYLSGLINFGIFPSISARFFMAICGLPDQFHLGGLELATYPLLMAVLILVALFFTFVGGQISVMVTEFLQGSFVNLVFAVLIIYLLATFNWSQIGTALLSAPPERSLVHPFHIGQEANFNFWYFVIDVVIMFYGVMSWQGTQGYNSAALNPHEAKMAGILQGWRWRVLMLITLIVPICVRTLLTDPQYAAQAAVVHERLAATDSETLQHQLRTPFALAVMLPPGLLGLACAAALAAHISTHASYLHSWGSILVQDVLLPFRRTPLAPAEHLRWLKLSICFVAIFIYVFSLLFKHTQFVAMFCSVTAAVFVGGAGSVIIGGLYWKRGTTSGAWSAILTGMILSLAKIVLEQFDLEYLRSLQGHGVSGALAAVALFIRTRLTGQEMSFCAIAGAVGAYVLVSLLGPRKIFDMDWLLHRGRHAVAGEAAVEVAPQHWWEKLGFTREFTGRDRIITYITLGWPLAWTLIFIVGTVYNLAVDVPSTAWLAFWQGWTWVILAASILVTIWFTIGGFYDLRRLYRGLRMRRTDATDDGRVARKA